MIEGWMEYLEYPRWFQDRNFAVLDARIAWAIGDPRYCSDLERGKTMQCQWTIEARADFADKEKVKLINQAMRTAAVHIYAKLLLLKDHQQPEVALFSDDFFEGNNEIGVLYAEQGDVIGDAIANAQVDAEDTVSAELLEAARDMRTHKGV